MKRPDRAAPMKRAILAMLGASFGAFLFGPSPATAASCLPPPSGMVAWWPGDGNADDQVAGRDATANGGATFTTGSGGKVGEAFVLDGTDDFFNIPHDSAFNLSSAISIEAWVQAADFTDDPDFAAIVTKGDSAWRMQRHFNSDNAAFGTSGLSNIDQVGNDIIDDGGWHHVVATFDDSTNTKTLYVDGAVDATDAATTGSISTNSQPVRIGHNSEETDRYWEGLIDEVTLYNRALSAAEVAALDAADSDGKCKTATTLTVTRPDDPTPDSCLPLDCSLREAVIAANGNPGADTINVPGDPYELTRGGANEDAASTGDLDITEDVTIAGDGATSTIIESNDLDRVFHVLSGTTVDISDVTIRNGTGNATTSADPTNGWGGGIYNAGSLTLTDTIVTQNVADNDDPETGQGRAGGIYNSGGTLELDGSSVTDNTAPTSTGLSGGIFSVGGTLTLTDSEVSSNSAGSQVAGIEADNTAFTITRSTISGNNIIDGGAALAAGIAAEGGSFSVTNSTVSGNFVTSGSAFAGGIFYRDMSPTITNSTIANNTGTSGAIHRGSGPDVTATNVIVSGNSSPECSMAVTSTSGNNIESGTSCFQAGDLQSTDPLLGALAYNGGPTKTHALGPGSPAIDAGTNTGCPTHDQRGAPRSVAAGGDGMCDIGAYELAPTTFTVNSSLDTDDGNCTPGDCTLREAINAANAVPSVDIIEFDISGTGPHTISVGSQLPALTDEVTIDGYTEPGAAEAASEATLMITISRSGPPADFGIWDQSSGSTIRGLNIQGFVIGILLHGENATVEGNYIGTTIDGEAAAASPNTFGIDIDFDAGPGSGTNNLIGGPDIADRNVISGNTSQGIFVANANPGPNTIQGNIIGTDDGGDTAIPNDKGVSIHNGYRVTITQNSIYGNTGLGIDVDNDGSVTPNDQDDPDTGPNDQQNFPVITDVATTPTTTEVEGTLNSIANEAFDLEFFASDACDSSGNGEGQTYIGTIDNVATDSGGDASFAETFTADTEGMLITATATNAAGSTSEFSVCFLAGPLVVNSTDDDGDTNTADPFCDTGGTVGSDPECTLRAAIEQAEVNAGADDIEFDIPGTGPFTITPGSALPTITDPVTIDGYTEDGAAPAASPATIMIQIDGTSAGGGVDGLQITTSDSTIKGLSITSFGGDGIELSGAGATGNAVEGNYIGLGTDGTSDLGNGAAGVFLSNGASTNTVGGAMVTQRNVLSGNGGGGVTLQDASTSGNDVLGNYIGTDAAGTSGIPNAVGVVISNAAGNNIGNGQPGGGNVVSGNTFHGVDLIDDDQAGSTFDATGNKILGNYVGTDAGGTSAVPNGVNGVVVNGASTSTVGGTDAASRNVISGNTGSGLVLNNSATATVVQGNHVGVGSSGASLPNLGNGIDVIPGSFPGNSNNTIGGTGAGEGNVIANNDTGIRIADGTGSAVSGNSVFDNAELGIDLVGGTEDANGVTANDADDLDSGPNNLQNYPVITDVTPGSTTVEGTLDSAASTTFDIDVYSNESCDASGNGEGQTYIGSFQTTTDVNGDASFSETLTGYTVADGEIITATATDPSGNTSEFSACGLVGPMVVNSTDDDTDDDTSDAVCDTGGTVGSDPECTLRAAIEQANVTSGQDEIEFDIPGATDTGCSGTSGEEVCTIDGSSELPPVSDPVTIDGYTQTGADEAASAADLKIDLDGSNAGSSRGLVITGGDSTVRGLVIHGFADDGIELNTEDGNTIQGNHIGTDVAGTADDGNGSDGIEINGSAFNTIGGIATAARNVISGNTGHGIEIGTSGKNVIRGNYIGVDSAGAGDLGNGGNGVVSFDGALNTIGGTGAGHANLIAFNGFDGVNIQGSSANGNEIRGNSIHTNDEQGIDLAPTTAGGGSDGLTANDADDPDSGGNNLQNFPVLTLAQQGSTRVQGTLDSLASTVFDLDFYSSPACDGTHGEGQTYLGSGQVTTDANGDGSFNILLAPTATVGHVVTATATDPSGNTSEFSECRTVTAAPGGGGGGGGGPPPDPDGDGITGGNDLCPNEAEDADGFEDSDGCPEPDNDEDTILDADDACPDEAEDADGFEDDDGCPEDGPAQPAPPTTLPECQANPAAHCGTDGDDSITIDGNGQTWYLGAGNDTVIVTGCDNTIHLQTGNDTITLPGHCANTVLMGDGDDSATVSAPLLAPSSQRSASSVGTAPAGVTVSGEAGNDTIQGGLRNDSLRGGAGIDVISGRAGNDTIRGGGGPDKLRGGAGNDVIKGGGGSDSCGGGGGNNRLSGCEH